MGVLPFGVASELPRLPHELTFNYGRAEEWGGQIIVKTVLHSGLIITRFGHSNLDYVAWRLKPFYEVAGELNCPSGDWHEFPASEIEAWLERQDLSHRLGALEATLAAAQLQAIMDEAAARLGEPHAQAGRYARMRARQKLEAYFLGVKYLPSLAAH